MADIAIIGCTIHFFYFCQAKPVEYVKFVRRAETALFQPMHEVRSILGHKSVWRVIWLRVSVVAYFLAVLIGVMLCIGGGLTTLLSWIPHSWGNYDNRIGIYIFALMGAAFLTTQMGKWAYEIDSLETEKMGLTHSKNLFDRYLQKLASSRFPDLKQLDEMEEEIQKAELVESHGRVFNIDTAPTLGLLRLVQRFRQGIPETKDTKDIKLELPILVALREGNLEQFKQFLRENRLSVNAGHPGMGWTLLHHLAALGNETLPVHAKMAEELLKSGADVNCRTALGWTPLHLIVMGGEAESVGVAKVLIANGLDLKAVDNYGRDWEIYWQHGKEIYNLLKNASAVDRPPDKGY